MKKIWIIVLFCAGILGFVVGFIRFGGKQNNPIIGALSQIQHAPTPTPFPFQEMTIPFLRNRSYESQLGDMNLVTANDVYETYQTSYGSDGLVIHGRLFKPKGEMPGGFSAIVFVHGYIPPTTYTAPNYYVAYVDYLARNGFVVFQIDLRGHDTSEGEAEGAYYSSAYVVDTLSAYTALSHADFVNPKRIGLWGHSMAGNIVFRSWAVKPEIPAVVIWAGAGYTYTDLSTYRISDSSYQRSNLPPEHQKNRAQFRELYGEFSADSPFWRQVAVTDYLPDLKGAIEIHHAVDDPVVSIEYSRNIMKLLDATNIVHELFEYPTGGHNITGESFSSAMSRTVEFFRTHLGEK